MLRSLLVLPDGTALSAGEPGAAIVSTRLHRQVNQDTELTPGSVCAARLDCSLTEAAGVCISPGDTVQLYYIEDGAAPVLQGTFLVERTERRGLGMLELTAYDRLRLLDTDLTGWLMGLDGWPYTLGEFARLVCEACGLTLVTESIPDTPVRQFSAAGATGKDLMQWVCEAAGRFCRATPEGQVELAWYQDADLCLAPTAGESPVAYRNENLILTLPDLTQGVEGNVALDSASLALTDDDAGNAFLTVAAAEVLPVRMGSLRRADFVTEVLHKVQLRADEEDLGTVWPPESTGENTCIFTGNPLLTACGASELQSVAQSLYELLATMTYTPCKLEIPATAKVLPGMVLQVTDLTGARFTFPVMTAEIIGQKMVLEATGSANRSLSRAAHSYRALSGRVLRLRADVEGLYVENEDARGALATLSLAAENLRTQVESQSQTAEGITQQMTALEQTAQEVSLKVTTLEQEGVATVKTQSGYTFDDTGLRISRSGQQIVNLLDNTGMYVMRRDEIILQANDDGVEAADVTVRNYLNLGTHARLEDYSDGTDTKRTACYWMEGEDGD